MLFRSLDDLVAFGFADVLQRQPAEFVEAAAEAAQGLVFVAVELQVGRGVNDNNNSDSSDDKPSSGTDKKDVTAPKTGDNTPSVWLFILLILSGTGLIITVKKRRENLNS